MAQLTEFESKRLLTRYGVPVPESILARDSSEAYGAAVQLGGRVVVKAQLPAGGRGKAGAVRFADTPHKAREAFTAVTHVVLDGMRAELALVEAAADVAREHYLSIAFDLRSGCLSLLFGVTGGVNVESAQPLARIPLRADGTVSAAAFRRMAAEHSLSPKVAQQLLRLGQAMARAYRELDATLVEVNPVAVTADGQVCAVDARLIIDDHALFRQPELSQTISAMTPRPATDVMREQTRLEYVPLDGEIGLVSGGAGMTMAVMDLITELGANPACFLDCSANPTFDGYLAAFDVLNRNLHVQSILVSIFGGLTRVDSVARTLVRVLETVSPAAPVTVRLMGTNVDAADKVLHAAGITNHRDLREAAHTAVSKLTRAS